MDKNIRTHTARRHTGEVGACQIGRTTHQLRQHGGQGIQQQLRRLPVVDMCTELRESDMCTHVQICRHNQTTSNKQPVCGFGALHSTQVKTQLQFALCTYNRQHLGSVSYLVARGLSSGVHLGRTSRQLAGSLPFTRRSNSEACEKRIDYWLEICSLR